MQQRRLLLALILSSAILFLWTYFYPSPSPRNQQQQGAAATPSPTAAPTASQQAPVAAAPSSTSPLSTTINQAPQRTITVRTDLYEVKFDTRGAEPISWIIKKNRYSNTDIYSVAGKKSERKPLELISPEGLNRQPRQVRLRGRVLAGARPSGGASRRASVPGRRALRTSSIP